MYYICCPPNPSAVSDGGFTNFMMDASQMYGPEGVHPHERDKKYDFSGRARPYSRTERPPKYHFIVFGLSDIYDPDDLPATMCALEGRDKTVLEFFAYNPGTKRTPKHDPFAVDVYYLQSLPPQCKCDPRLRTSLLSSFPREFMQTTNSRESFAG